jgi:hypothetical protein
VVGQTPGRQQRRGRWWWWQVWLEESEFTYVEGRMRRAGVDI